jgi:GrpB-like predicted nucleotidyltransferase (UPF0157 family)
MKVTVVEYRPAWREMFEEERRRLEDVLGEPAAKIAHIGSTSVRGLAAKPVIDILIGLPDFALADSFVPKITALGYEYISKYEDEMPFRRFFAKNLGDVRTHQIHMVETGGDFWTRHLAFRDYLRQNPATAAEYAALKKRLAAREWTDVNAYADAKTEFIKDIETKARGQAAARDV